MMQHLALINSLINKVFKCFNTDLYLEVSYFTLNCPSTCMLLPSFKTFALSQPRVKRSQQVEWYWMNILVLFDHAFSRVLFISQGRIKITPQPSVSPRPPFHSCDDPFIHLFGCLCFSPCLFISSQLPVDFYSPTNYVQFN